jgi:hypothetical protein
VRLVYEEVPLSEDTKTSGNLSEARNEMKPFDSIELGNKYSLRSSDGPISFLAFSEIGWVAGRWNKDRVVTAVTQYVDDQGFWNTREAA